MNIGVDLGGVVIDSSGPDTFFGPDYLQVPPVAGSLEAVALLNERSTVHVVSKCGPKIERQSREWLAEVRFTESTGVTEDRWHFVRARPDKAVVATRLHLDAFVDDRRDVLEVMPAGVQRVLFGSELTPNWQHVLATLL